MSTLADLGLTPLTPLTRLGEAAPAIANVSHTYEPITPAAEQIEIAAPGQTADYSMSPARTADPPNSLRGEKGEKGELNSETGEFMGETVVRAGEGFAPAGSCPDCHLNMWWQRPDRGWVCGICHPDPEMLRAAWLQRREPRA